MTTYQTLHVLQLPVVLYTNTEQHLSHNNVDNLTTDMSTDSETILSGKLHGHGVQQLALHNVMMVAMEVGTGESK